MNQGDLSFAQVFPRGTTYQTDYDTQLTQKLKEGYTCVVNQTWDGKPVSHNGIKIKMHWHFERVRGAPHKRVIVVEFSAPLHDDPEPPLPPGPTPHLWDYEVVEFFFANNDGHYLEVEVGPHGHWLVLLHKGYRDCFNAGEDIDLDVENTFDMGTWNCRLEIPLAYFPAKVTKFNAYAIHGEGEDRQYEALSPVTDGLLEKPNFHKLEYFKKIDTLRFIPETYNNQVFVDAKYGNMWSIVAPDDDEVEPKRQKRDDDWLFLQMEKSVIKHDEFCVLCGTILPIPKTAPCVIRCTNCDSGWSVPVRRRELVYEYKKLYHKIQSDLDEDQSPPEEGSIVEHVCSKCEYGFSTFNTRQTRSADEGQTVYYTCMKCKWTDVEFS